MGGRVSLNSLPTVPFYDAPAEVIEKHNVDVILGIHIGGY